VDVFPDHGWKHIHIGFYTETGGYDCSSKNAPDDGQNVARNNKRFYN
jgi:hypothetical protein